MDKQRMKFTEYHRQVIRFKHWSPATQPIASPEILINRLELGWEINTEVGVETYSYGPGREIHVYHFTLCRENDTMAMPVYSNPVVRRLLQEKKCKLVPYEGKKTIANAAV